MPGERARIGNAGVSVYVSYVTSSILPPTTQLDKLDETEAKLLEKEDHSTFLQVPTCITVNVSLTVIIHILICIPCRV